MLFEGVTTPEYVKVASNTGVKYYKLLADANEIAENNEGYVNEKWFPTRYENTVTPDTVDILFNRMLNLSSNRILKTKGSKQAIEMVFAMFGFGKYDRDENPSGDYTIEERYGTSRVKNYDDVFYFYEEIPEDEVVGAAAPKDAIPTDATGGSDEFIRVTYTNSDGTEYTVYYKLNGDYTVYEAIKLLYAHRTTEREDDNYYSGVPVNDMYRGSRHLIVPFMDARKQYEGNAYFEGKGGWMRTGNAWEYVTANVSDLERDEYVVVEEKPTNVTERSPEHICVRVGGEDDYYDKIEINQTWNYCETIPYLHILQRISDLFTIDTRGVDNNDIYFVADVSDYYEYSEYTPSYLSNFFKLINKYNPSIFSSWVNIPIEGTIQFGQEGYHGVTYDDYQHAKHLDEIIPTILFNNPHCGYDRYDLGADYKKYMEYPYTYSVDNYLYDDEFYRNMASQFHFLYTDTQSQLPYRTEKESIVADTYAYVDDRIVMNLEDREPIPTMTVNDKFLKLTLFSNGQPVDNYSTDARFHLEYMRNVVMKYVAQVIPSTTLLVLDNFVPVETTASDYATVTIIIENEGWGYVYGAGSYLKSSLVTLKAVANEGYHFLYWSWIGLMPTPVNPQSEGNEGTDRNTTSTLEEITIMVCDDITFTAVFTKDCAVEFGCSEIECATHYN